MMDDKGQVALEYMLIFAVSLILLIVFTLPLSETTIQNTLDVSDTLNAKSDLSKIAQAVSQVYGQGQGSKQSVHIVSSDDIDVNVNQNYISSTLKLNDGSKKVEKINFKSTLEKSNVHLRKGENSITVDWPESSQNMRIYVN
nr:class III signal peptide-containing protein [uncultured Methanobrevibacter sp.]